MRPGNKFVESSEWERDSRQKVEDECELEKNKKENENE